MVKLESVEHAAMIKLLLKLRMDHYKELAQCIWGSTIWYFKPFLNYHPFDSASGLIVHDVKVQLEAVPLQVFVTFFKGPDNFGINTIAHGSGKYCIGVVVV